MLRALPLLAASLAAGFACSVLLRAAALERGGRLDAARRLVRSGGFLLATGALTETLAILLCRRSSSPLLLVAVLAATFGSGCVGLLAGLSRKPRPSALVAAGLWLAGTLLAWLCLRPAGC